MAFSLFTTFCALSLLLDGVLVIASPITLPLHTRAFSFGTSEIQQVQRERAYLQRKLRAAEANWKSRQDSAIFKRDHTPNARAASASQATTELTECMHLHSHVPGVLMLSVDQSR
jgi:hypothetical protein